MKIIKRGFEKGHTAWSLACDPHTNRRWDGQSVRLGSSEWRVEREKPEASVYHSSDVQDVVWLVLGQIALDGRSVLEPGFGDADNMTPLFEQRGQKTTKPSVPTKNQKSFRIRGLHLLCWGLTRHGEPGIKPLILVRIVRSNRKSYFQRETGKNAGFWVNQILWMP